MPVTMIVAPPVAAIAIPADVLDAMFAHAIAAFPDECCGYLVGDAPPPGAPDAAGAVDAAVACRNAQTDGEHPIAPARGADTGFVISGAELLRFARSFDTERPARIVYHSHTHGRAYFSAVDRSMAVTPGGPAYPVQHLVIGVAMREPAGAAGATGATGRAGIAIIETAQFAWSDAAGDYVEVARWSAAAGARR